MRILILGGTTEASALAQNLAGDARFDVTLSFAGRTIEPKGIDGITSRIGGFGGSDGLAHWLQDNAIDAVIDATHPFAAQISTNAASATEHLALPLCTVVRPPWSAQAGDTWHVVANMEAAADKLGTAAKRVFLSIGRQGVGAFRQAPHHDYLIRVIERPADDLLPPDVTLIQSRGPFTLENERDLLRQHAVDVIVTKNAGGSATDAKLSAARELAIPVIMVERPQKVGTHFVSSPGAALQWLEALHTKSRSERGV